MEDNNTLNEFLRKILEPIIDDCIRRSMMKYLAGMSQEPQANPGAYDITEAAKYVKLAKPTLYGLVAKRKIPHYKIGKRLYFRKNDLDEWINTGRVKTEQEIIAEVDKYIVKRKGRHHSY